MRERNLTDLIIQQNLAIMKLAHAINLLCNRIEELERNNATPPTA